jgi:chaperonin cofactor prefoldin
MGSTTEDQLDSLDRMHTKDTDNPTTTEDAVVVLEQKVRSLEETLEATREELQAALAEARLGTRSRRVLHDVANELTKVGISARLIAVRLEESRVSGVAKVATLLREAELPDNLLPAAEYLDALGRHLQDEQTQVSKDVGTILRTMEMLRDLIHSRHEPEGEE